MDRVGAVIKTTAVNPVFLGERGHDGNKVPTIEAVGGESSHGQTPCSSFAPLSTGRWGFDIGITAAADHDSDILIDPSSFFGLV